MPYVVPALALGVGTTGAVWGGTMIYRGDDSADEALADFIGRLPRWLNRFVVDFSLSPDGATVTIRHDAPPDTESRIWKKSADDDEIDGEVKVEREDDE